QEVRPSKHTVLDDDGKDDLLTDTLRLDIFGPQPNNIESNGVLYIVAMRVNPSPHPAKFVEFLRAQHPSATEDGMAKAWKLIKDFFSSDDVTTFERLRDLINVDEFVAAFKSAPYMDIAESSTAATATATIDAPLPPPVRIPSSAPTRSTRTRNGNSINNSNSSGSSLNAVGLAKMREEFSAHFGAFNGQSWVLASGTVVDQVIADYVKVLSHESTLHSFIVEDTRAIVDLFPESDKVE
ncbi:hypothetical protein BGX31_004801, partial [Mortierella sp. GBA43]